MKWITALVLIIVVAAATSTISIGGAESSGSWFATIGGLDDEQGWFGITVSGDTVIAVGEASSFGAGSSDALIVAMSDDGLLKWAVTIGGASSENFRDVAIGPNGSIAAVGMGRSFGAGSTDAIIGKFDEFGNTDWFYYVGGEALDSLWSVAIDANGSIIASGYTLSFNATKLDTLIIKFSPDGRVEWAERIGGPAYEYGWAVAVDSEGNIFVGGQTSSTGAGSHDGLIMKLSSDGRILWAIAIGGPASDSIYSIKPCDDGSVIFAGGTMSIGAGRYDVLVGKYVPGSGLAWVTVFGGESNDMGYGVDVAPNGDIVVSGYTYSFATGDQGKSDAFIAVLSPDGVLKHFIHIGGPYTEFSYAVTADEEGNAFITGKVDSFGTGGLDMLIAKIGPALIADPKPLMWTSDEFPLQVNISAASPAINTTALNVTEAVFDTAFVSPIVTDPGVTGRHWLPETHLATEDGNPPFAVTLTSTVTETETYTITETSTVTETETETETVTTTTTETTTQTITETLTETQTETVTTTQTVTTTETETRTETVTETLITTTTQTMTSIKTETSTFTTTSIVEVVSSTTLAGVAVLGLLIGIGIGFVVFRRK